MTKKVLPVVIGPLVVPEARNLVTPYLSWDNGEVSGPSGNWRHAPLTVEHLTLAVESLGEDGRAAFFAEIFTRLKRGRKKSGG